MNMVLPPQQYYTWAGAWPEPTLHHHTTNHLHNLCHLSDLLSTLGVCAVQQQQKHVDCWVDIVDMVCSLWPILILFGLFLQNSRSGISYFRIPVFLVIRIVFHFTPRIPTILLWPSASATCIYDIDYELQGIALNWHHQSYWVGIIISQSHISKVFTKVL